jgi:hypothetical protein
VRIRKAPHGKGHTGHPSFLKEIQEAFVNITVAALAMCVPTELQQTKVFCFFFFKKEGLLF